MHISFTKMQGAGNDFVVLDETRGRLNLSAAQYRFLADRHFGVGADQILSVRAAQNDSADFEYAIHNADGGEVEHCGNGARCFVRYVRERGLTDKTTIRVKTINSTLILTEQPDGRVTVDMGAPRFDLPATVFDTAQAYSKIHNSWEIWHIPDVDINKYAINSIVSNTSLGSTATAYACDVAVLSMGNPHAVQVVPDVDTAGVLTVGPWLESHPAFARRVNAGFMQIVSRQHIRLRVYERGAGETLACGTGACAAVVAGIRLGLLDERVDVHSRGGVLTVQWAGLSKHLNAPVLMTGPATTVFMGSIEVSDNLV